MFSWMPKTRNLRPIALDIGHNSIKMLQLLIRENQISVIAADKIRIDQSINGDQEQRRQFVVAAIKRTLAEGDFHGRSVISCVPNNKLKITSLRLPEMETDQVRDIIEKEAAHRFGLDPACDSINHMVAGVVQQGDEVKKEFILFATDNATIKSHIAMLEEAQLKPVAIDTVPCALFRGFERSLRRQEDKERTMVFVDIGSRFTTVVFGRAGEICFIKILSVGGENFDKEIALKLGIDLAEAAMLRSRLRAERALSAAESQPPEQNPDGDQQVLDATTRQAVVDAVTAVAEELAREISLCLKYYTVTFRGKRGDRAWLTGGGAYESILLNVLTRTLGVEIEVAQPLRGFGLSSKGMHINLDGDRRGLLCEWAIAVGLGLKGYAGAVN